MTVLLFANNASAVLASPISSSATSLTLAAGGGALFPNPGAGQAFRLTLLDAATRQLREIMQCSTRSGDLLTVIRGMESTTPQAWAAGDIASQLVTAGTMNQFYQSGGSAYGGGSIAIANGTVVNAGVTVATLTAPFTGTMSINGAISVTSGASLFSANSTGGLFAKLKRGATFVGASADGTYVPNGQPFYGSCNVTNLYLAVTAGDVITMTAQTLFSGDNATSCVTVQDAGATTQNALTWHYVA